MTLQGQDNWCKLRKITPGPTGSAQLSVGISATTGQTALGPLCAQASWPMI